MTLPGILCFAHGSITMREWSWYDVDFWPQGQIHRTWLYVQVTAFLSFDVIIQCMVLCIAYIHDLCMTLTFDLNIKIVYFHHEFDLASFSLLFYISIPILVYGCITRRQHVVYILDLCFILTFDLYGVMGVWVLLTVFILFSQTAKVHGQVVPNRKRWKWKDKLTSGTTMTTKIVRNRTLS